MVEAGLGSTGPTRVARAKFGVPRVPNASVRRDALLARLDAAADCPLTLVVAAPGSGKTACLVQWVERLDRQVAWLSCDATDADPAGFWRNVATGVGRAWADAGMAAAEHADGGSSHELAIGLANELGALAQPGVIVIDDFHLARPRPATMTAFVTALPPGVRLVLGSRRDPPFPVGRLRVQGRLLELRRADLRFTAAEARRLLDDLGVEVGEQELEQITSITEGWTAGVHLAGLWLRVHCDPAGLLQGLAETDRGLIDFLVNEVVDLQPPEILDFLMTTAELETFDVALCDAVRHRHDSAELLRRVRTDNLFLTELDRVGGWYRYHPLFAQFLQGRLRAVAPERVPAIHRAAAEAFGHRGDAITAVHHSLAAGDTVQALARLEAHVTGTWSLEDQTTGGTTVLAWLREHGIHQIERSPQTVLACTIVLNVTGHHDHVDAWLRAVEAREPSLDDQTRGLLHAAWSFDRLLQGDPQAALARARRAEAVLGDSPVRSAWIEGLPTVVIQACLWLDDFDGAGAVIDAVRGDPARPAVVSQVRMPAFASWVAALRGELTVAERSAAEALAAADRLELTDRNFGRADPHLSLAAVAIERDHLDAAEEHLEQVMRIVEAGRRPPIEILAHAQLALVASARGDFAAAANAVEQARALLPRATAPVVAQIDQVALRVALDRGDEAAAAAIAARLPPSPTSDLLTAYVRLAVGDRPGAVVLLDAIADGLTTRRLEIEHGLLRALAIASDDTAHAHDLLRAVLELAQPDGYLRALVGAGPDLWRLLESLPAPGPIAGYVAEVLDAAARVLPAPKVATTGDLVDPLTERERTVLRYLASRLTSTEIASELHLSVNTVRSHEKAIHRKLAVSSRAGAVTRGRSLGLT